MTLDLNVVTPVARESAIRIRDILRRANGGFREDWLSDKFHYPRHRAEEIANAMGVAGYVRRDRERELRNQSPFPWYTVTDAGRDLIRASAAQRIKRETATISLSEFMKRVDLVNANPKYLYSVTRVVVFGSFLDRAERLGDIDVAVDLKPRIASDREHKWAEVFRLRAWESGRSFSAFEDEIDWPRQEVLLILKSRKRSISIQSWYSFMEMKKEKNFRYKVLLGCAKEVGRELAKAERAEREV